MAPSIKDFGELLSSVPVGAWVAISHDETRVIAYGNEVQEVLEAARLAGEENPIIIRSPRSATALAL